MPDDEEAYASLLSHTGELSGAMRKFLGRNGQSSAKPDARSTNDRSTDDVLLRKLTADAVRCREKRQELSLIMLAPSSFDPHGDPNGELASHRTRRALASACARFGDDRVTLLSMSKLRSAAIVSDCDRRTALAIARHAMSELGNLESGVQADTETLASTLGVGVATASAIARNFNPAQMIERAMRCMNAAISSGINSVKSIEV
jgi:hypothetical protein